jgi:hypothetical protein
VSDSLVWKSAPRPRLEAGELGLLVPADPSRPQAETRALAIRLEPTTAAAFSH